MSFILDTIFKFSFILVSMKYLGVLSFKSLILSGIFIIFYLIFHLIKSIFRHPIFIEFIKAIKK